MKTGYLWHNKAIVIERKTTEMSGKWDEQFLNAYTFGFCEKRGFTRGTGWWDWSATRLYPEETGMDQNGYCTYGKPANELLKLFSEKIRP